MSTKTPSLDTFRSWGYATYLRGETKEDLLQDIATEEQQAAMIEGYENAKRLEELRALGFESEDQYREHQEAWERIKERDRQLGEYQLAVYRETGMIPAPTTNNSGDNP